MIKKAKAKKLIQQGKHPLEPLINTPCLRTCCNYKAFIAIMDGVFVKQSTINKTVKREMAENSLRAVVAYICVIAATHIIATEEEAKDLITAVTIKASAGAKKLFNFMMKVLGGKVPLTIVQPRYILTTDDVATYWLPDILQKKEAKTLVRSLALEKAGV